MMEEGIECIKGTWNQLIRSGLLDKQIPGYPYWPDSGCSCYQAASVMDGKKHPTKAVAAFRDYLIEEAKTLEGNLLDS